MSWNPFKKKSKQLSSVEYQEKFKSLWEDAEDLEKIPRELVYAIGSLSDEATRNGNMNWDEEDEDSVDYLRAFLPNDEVFDAATIQKIEDCLDVILEAGKDEEDRGLTAYDELEYVMNRVVDFCVTKA